MPSLQKQQDLANIGTVYSQMGYSVIPCLGDLSPDQPKRAAIPWQDFTTRRASVQLINKWFLQDNYGALAIVLGRVSGLICLDFDSDVRAKEFEARYPELQNTWVIRSAGRGLPHYYFKLPAGVSCSTIIGHGVELRGDSAYVLAPPSIIAGKPYRRISKTSRPRLLSSEELESIRAFCQPAPTTVKQELGIELTSGVPTQFSLNELAARYQALAPAIGRNNALFRVAIEGRDSGLSVWETTRALMPLHMAQPGKPEPGQKRKNEAIKTIASAYSKPPRSVRLKGQKPGLPNAIRESLLQAGQTIIARVLDALFAVADWKPGRRFTEAQAMRVCRPLHIARKSVRAALIWLRTLTLAPRPLLENSPAPLTQIQSDSESIPCGIVGVQKGTIQKRYVYTMPRRNDLAAYCGVSVGWADRIQADDLHSSREYRQALYRGILQRKPGQYPRNWHSKRLGVSRWTIRRYALALNVKIEPVFYIKKMEWGAIKTLPQDEREVLPGIWLEIVPKTALNSLHIGARPGKKYPPLAGVAMKLFARAKKNGGRLALIYQQANHYRMIEDTNDNELS